METHSENSPDPHIQVRELYMKLLDSWNDRNPNRFAELFAPDGNVIGFDGTQVNGSTQIHAHLTQIFNSHITASYISIIREIRQLSPDVVALRAVVGMIPPGKKDINPELNAIQTLIAQKHKEGFRIAVFQNTPAAFHEHPEQREQLIEEFRQVLQ
jgi:uncharacterized protein (TIGR02246 family)